MGLLISILFSYVGAVELMFVVRDIVHQIGCHHEKMRFNRGLSQTMSSLHDLQEDLRKSIKSAQVRLIESDSIHSMADDVQYVHGYRILPANEQDIQKRWLEARAKETFEPSHSIYDTNNVVKSTQENVGKNHSDDDDDGDGERGSSQQNSRSISAETIIAINDLNGSNSNNASTHSSPHQKSDDDGNDDDAKKKTQRKTDNDPHRRKSYKTYASSSSQSPDAIQRRRSEDIDGQTDNPWGELRPESFHDAELWSRERTMSIAENEEMTGLPNEKSNRDSKRTDSTSMTATTNVEKKNEDTEWGPNERRDSDVSNEIPNNLLYSSDEIDRAYGSSNAKQIRNVPEILVDGSNIDDIVEDGKIGEFIDYIERIYDNNTASDKLQFKEYSEPSTRLRHSSYNYEADKDNEIELNEISMSENVEIDATVDLVNEYKSSIGGGDGENDDGNGTAHGLNARKPNMFAPQFDGIASGYRPTIRITPTEDERVEHFLQEEHINNTERFAGDILIKSRTTQMFECQDDTVSNADSCESDSQANSPSPTEAIIRRRESTVSDIGSEPIQFECKPPETPNYSYQREDSSSSNKSNILFERSQSRFSELEYIKGRDDWKDDYIQCDISEEIDSDNYHHLRRHSEAADTLEYIRGREDWLRNELHRCRRRSSLPRIFEVGEPRMLIQDEIDSDEYHHNFFQHDTFRSASESNSQIKKIARKHNVDDDDYNDDDDVENIDAFGKQFRLKSVDNINSDLTTAPMNLNDSTSTVDTSVSSQRMPTMNDEHSVASNTVQSNNEATIFNKSGEINVVIEDLITHDTHNNDDIEITVWDLTPEPEKNNPFILISEATDDNQHISTESGLNKLIGLLHPDSIDISTSDDASNINNNMATGDADTDTIQPYNINNDDDDDDDADDDNVHVTKDGSSNSRSGTSEFLNAEIRCETSNRQANRSDNEATEIEFQAKNAGTLSAQPYNRNVRAKSERLDTTTTDLLRTKSTSEQNLRRALSFENVEDLIRDVSNGPFFHN